MSSQIFEFVLQDRCFTFHGFDGVPNQVPGCERSSSFFVTGVMFVKTTFQIIGNALVELT